MSNTIAKAAVVLSTNNAALNKGLDDAKKKTTSWTSGLSSALVGGIAGGIAGTLTSALSSGLSALPGLFSSALASLDDLGKRGEQGLALGLTPETFTGLSEGFADFGLEGDKVLKMFGTLNESGAIAGGSLEEKVFAAADAIANAGGASEQAAKAQELFGGAALKVLPVLSQGAEGLRKLVAEQLALGAAVGGADFEKLAAAREALDRISDAGTGLWNKILVGAAPVLEAVANGIADWVEWFSKTIDVGATVQEVVRAIGKTVAWVVDVVKAVGGAAQVAFGYLADGVAVAVKGVKLLVTAGAALPENLGGGMFKGAADALGDVEQKLADFAAGSKDAGQKAIFAFGEGPKAFDRAFDEILNKPRNVRKPAIGQPVVDQMKPIKLEATAAMTQGSAAAIGVEQKFRFAGLMGQKPNAALDAQKKANELLKDIKEGIKEVVGVAKGGAVGVL